MLHEHMIQRSNIFQEEADGPGRNSASLSHDDDHEVTSDASVKVKQQYTERICFMMEDGEHSNLLPLYSVDIWSS